MKEEEFFAQRNQEMRHHTWEKVDKGVWHLNKKSDSTYRGGAYLIHPVEGVASAWHGDYVPLYPAQMTHRKPIGTGTRQQIVDGVEWHVAMEYL